MGIGTSVPSALRFRSRRPLGLAVPKSSLSFDEMLADAAADCCDNDLTECDGTVVPRVPHRRHRPVAMGVPGYDFLGSGSCLTSERTGFVLRRYADKSDWHGEEHFTVRTHTGAVALKVLARSLRDALCVDPKKDSLPMVFLDANGAKVALLKRYPSLGGGVRYCLYTYAPNFDGQAPTLWEDGPEQSGELVVTELDDEPADEAVSAALYPYALLSVQQGVLWRLQLKRFESSNRLESLVPCWTGVVASYYFSMRVHKHGDVLATVANDVRHAPFSRACLPPPSQCILSTSTALLLHHHYSSAARRRLTEWLCLKLACAGEQRAVLARGAGALLAGHRGVQGHGRRRARRHVPHRRQSVGGDARRRQESRAWEGRAEARRHQPPAISGRSGAAAYRCA